MPTETPLPEVLTPAEAARLMGASVESIRRWSKLGYIPSHRTPGGQRRFYRAELEALIEKGWRPA